MARRSGGGSSPTRFLYLSWTYVLLGALFPFIVLPLLLYRWFLISYVKCFRPDLSHILRGHGGLLLRDAVHKEPNMNVVVNFQLEGSPNMENIKSIVNDRMVLWMEKKNGQDILAQQELQQYCVKFGGYFFWKHEHAFSIDDHLRFYKLDQLKSLTSFRIKYLQQPMPNDKSPWQVTVVEGGVDQSDYPDSYNMFIKYHHSLADGFSVLQLLTRLNDVDVAVVYQAPVTVGSSCLNKLTLPARAAYAFFRVLTSRTPCLPWPKTPAVAYNGPTRQRYFRLSGSGSGQSVQMEKIKRIARRHSVSMTAVIYGAITGALHDHLVSKYGKQKVPAYVKFFQPVSSLWHPRGLCNAISGVIFKLHVGEPDPIARIVACDRMIQECKLSLEGPISYMMLKIRCLLPYTFPFLLQFDSTSMHICSAYIAGSIKPAFIGGQHILRMDFQITAPPSDFFVFLDSYNGVLEWSCTSDTRVLSQEELGSIAAGIAEEFETLDRIPKPTPGSGSESRLLEV